MLLFPLHALPITMIPCLTYIVSNICTHFETKDGVGTKLFYYDSIFTLSLKSSYISYFGISTPGNKS